MAVLDETRRFTTADGGHAITATMQLIPIATNGKLADEGTLTLLPHTFATAVVCKVLLNPRLTVLVTNDAMATYVDESDDAQDGSASTDVTLSSLEALADGGAVYIGSALPIRGVRADVDAPNGTASVLAAHYWNGTAWTSLSPTDGTADTGKTFGQDGDITWTVPTAWVAANLSDADLGITAAQGAQASDAAAQVVSQNSYWVRLSVSVVLDSATTLNSLLALNRSTAYTELAANQLFAQQVTTLGSSGIGCVEAVTNAGTASLIGHLEGTFA